MKDVYEMTNQELKDACAEEVMGWNGGSDNAWWCNSKGRPLIVQSNWMSWEEDNDAWPHSAAVLLRLEELEYDVQVNISVSPGYPRIQVGVRKKSGEGNEFGFSVDQILGRAVCFAAIQAVRENKK